MLPRSMKTSGVELPGVGPREVPLIGYRPLQPQVDGQKDQLGMENENREEDHTQGEPSPMKTTWYCPLDLSTVSEMEEDGIIYTVVVKQGHSSPARPQSSASRSQHVKAGTEEKLVLHLLHSFSMGDSSFISIFLSTYRSFTSTQRVLDILTDRLGNPPGESNGNTRQMFNKAVCTVFSTWMSDYPEDFRSLNDPSCLLRLAPLLPTDTLGAEIKGRLLRIAEELSEKTLLSGSLSDPTKGMTFPPDPSEFDATSILGFPSSVIAEQLTRIETDLFLKLVPYHCLGSLWSQRDKKGQEGACWSVRATIKQFNRLANAVTASCLWNTGLKSQQRARLLEKWISVAEACRSRKNFSSLYAILSALQSNPIHRLRKTWQETDREAVRRYEELSDIFSEKDNYSQSRELLKEEGTSKFSNADTKINNRRFTGNGFINLDKRRREFEVIAQIRLLQSSCRNSIFRTDETFVQWYHSVPTLREEESYKLSNQIEAPGEPSPGRGLNPTVIITQCPDALSAVANSTMDADGIFDFPSPVNHLLSRLYKHVKSPSVSCLDVDSSPPPNDATPSVLTTPTTAVKSHRRSVSCGNNPTNNKKEAGPDIRIVRIRMDLHDGNLYRSILVTSNDKTPTVISSALEKHNQNAQEASKYELIQLLPEGKELLIPPTGNVFYAMSSASVDFLLRRRGGNTPTGSPTLGNETSATFPRIKAKGRRLVRTLF
ncbi:ral guanine nucleotide dissociation stimulator-like 2 isoform X3 [Puntigrus tetrazona]|uniref:ral guanine nucleotide dissociation stimulator-like 2 isoform X3 n=1 Tax=Puntigrus tetrazona TaxID=1606681 RepID=UPI001C8AB78E|nr:ral guanine nucleotide dissociation stimulator-like 2 isoform X3 [Puntigrus tetrazona]